MKLPRDLSGVQLINSLKTLGYTVTHQTGSHVRLTTQEGGEHHITIPRHSTLRVGTVGQIVADVAKHFDFSRDDLIKKLFGR